ncbi:hypothetical protein TA3x_000676 [Tundrisphaera sp. TA3]|uniref:hypothetical protein n=1 Tax=Tundrisphaera sp. TA3 TaxID=3435775 RepID=UPI003EB902F2
MPRMFSKCPAALAATLIIGACPAWSQSPQTIPNDSGAQGRSAPGTGGEFPYGDPLGGGGGMAPGGADGAGRPPQAGASEAYDAAGRGPGTAPGSDVSPLADGSIGGDAGGGDGGAGGVSPGLGGNASVAAAPPGVIGDYQPFTSFRAASSVKASAARSKFPNLPTPLPPPGAGEDGRGVPNPNGTTAIIYKLAGLKISDNQSPRPQDRIYYSFNYFDDMGAAINKRLGSPVENIQVYHQLFGLEKTFLDGKASLGLRLPLDTISQNVRPGNPQYAGLGGSKTALGDLSIIGKYAIYDTGRTFFSLGLQVTAPTGPGGFAGNKYYSYFRDTQIQPFVGYVFARDRFFIQGFSAIAVPTMSQDVTMLFNDVALGVYAYRSDDASRLLTAIVPTIEAHLSTPLNHRYFNPDDVATTPDVLNLTFGVNAELHRRAYLSAAYITPVTGPKPFNAELALQLNIRFGGNYRTRPAAFPLIGN